MEIFVSLLNTLKSPKTSITVLLFCLLALFFPYDVTGVVRPKFVDNYEAIITTVMFLSASVLGLELLQFGWLALSSPFRARRRKQYFEDMFLSLNLDELCVLYAMVESGTRVVKGPVTGHIMTSLREKGALQMMAGFQSLHEASHRMPEELAAIVLREGKDRFPIDLANSSNFVDEVRERLDRAINWRRN